MGGAQAELFSACANRHRPHHDMVRWAGKMLGHEGGHEDSRQIEKFMQFSIDVLSLKRTKWFWHLNLVTFCLACKSHLRGLVFDMSLNHKS